MIENIIIAVAAIALVLGFHCYWAYYKDSGQRELEKWAYRKGYTILHSELRNFKTGPFFISNRSRLQRVFYATLENDEGKRSNAWIKIGGVASGLFSDRIEVRWEKQKTEKL